MEFPLVGLIQPCYGRSAGGAGLALASGVTISWTTTERVVRDTASTFRGDGAVESVKDLWEWLLIFAAIVLLIVGFSFIGWLYKNVDRLLAMVLP